MFFCRICAQFAVSLVAVENLSQGGDGGGQVVHVVHATRAETCIGKELLGFQLRPSDCITPNFKTDLCELN